MIAPTLRCSRGGVHLAHHHLGQALVDYRLHALEHVLGTEGAHVLDLVGEDRVLERDVRHDQRAGLALVGGVLDRAAGGGLDQVASRSSIMTAAVETPCSRNRPSWPIRPGTKGILSMASVSSTMEKALPEKMSRAGISVVLFERVARRQRAMMVSAASSPSAVVCSPPVIPAGQTSSAALTSARRTIAAPSASAAEASTAS